MDLKHMIITVLTLVIWACSNQSADMYEASDLSLMMREMVDWSKEAKQKLDRGERIHEVPAHFFQLARQKSTRNEHEEEAFQAMVPSYLDALKGIERKDSQEFYYNASIQACKNCHHIYCGGPMSIIEQL